MRTPISQKASSFVEILTALVIFSISLLGVGGVILRSLHATQEAFYRSLAITQIGSLGYFIQLNEQMNANAQWCDISSWQQEIATLLPVAKMNIHVLPPQTIVEISWRPFFSSQTLASLKLRVDNHGQQFID